MTKLQTAFAIAGLGAMLASCATAPANVASGSCTPVEAASGAAVPASAPVLMQSNVATRVVRADGGPIPELSLVTVRLSEVCAGRQSLFASSAMNAQGGSETFVLVSSPRPLQRGATYSLYAEIRVDGAVRWRSAAPVAYRGGSAAPTLLTVVPSRQ